MTSDRSREHAASAAAHKRSFPNELPVGDRRPNREGKHICFRFFMH
jgi:hypothetical protein